MNLFPIPVTVTVTDAFPALNPCNNTHNRKVPDAPVLQVALRVIVAQHAIFEPLRLPFPEKFPQR